MALTDSTGAVVEKVKYDPYGQPTCTRTSDNHVSVASHFGNPFLFQGQRYCPETGLYYFKNRDYSASLGRFNQWDLMGYLDGMSQYESEHGHPLRSLDPLGLQDQLERARHTRWVSLPGPRGEPEQREISPFRASTGAFLTKEEADALRRQDQDIARISRDIQLYRERSDHRIGWTEEGMILSGPCRAEKHDTCCISVERHRGYHGFDSCMGNCLYSWPTVVLGAVGTGGSGTLGVALGG